MRVDWRCVAPLGVAPGIAVDGAWSLSFVYPSKGQTPAPQKKDEYGFHPWAVGPAGFDPTQPKQSAYSAARSAGLEGRGHAAR